VLPVFKSLVAEAFRLLPLDYPTVVHTVAAWERLRLL
jgi:hypothetical protein